MIRCSFCSFLQLEDLRSVETVCARWRCACVDSGCGWATALSHARDARSFRHRIHSSQWTVLKTVQEFRFIIFACTRVFSKAPNIMVLSLIDSKSAPSALGLSLFAMNSFSSRGFGACMFTSCGERVRQFNCTVCWFDVHLSLFLCITEQLRFGAVCCDWFT